MASPSPRAAVVPLPKTLILALGDSSVLVSRDDEAASRLNIESTPRQTLTSRFDEVEAYGWVLGARAAATYPASKIVEMYDVEEANTAAIPVPMEVDALSVSVDKGVALVLAPTGWGKTVFMEKLLLPALMDTVDEEVEIVNYLEPRSFTPGVDYREQYAPADLLMLMGHAALSGRSMLVDSLRAFVYGRGRGGTGARGVDQFLFPQLTALSNLFDQVDAHLIMSLNPMVAESDTSGRYDEFADQLKASVTSCFIGGPKLSGRFYNRGRSVRARTEADATFVVPHLDLRGDATSGPKNHSSEIVDEVPTQLGQASSTLTASVLARSFSPSDILNQ